MEARRGCGRNQRKNSEIKYASDGVERSREKDGPSGTPVHEQRGTRKQSEMGLTMRSVCALVPFLLCKVAVNRSSAASALASLASVSM